MNWEASHLARRKELQRAIQNGTFPDIKEAKKKKKEKLSAINTSF